MMNRSRDRFPVERLTRAWRWPVGHFPWLWPYGALIAVLAVVMWPAWVTTDRLIIGGDALVIHYPWFVLWRDALAAGEFPFWNPYSFSGLPAFATLQAGYGYPPHWALTWLPAISAMNWMVGLHVMLAGIGAAWCCGRLGGSREGQFLAGVSYALGSALLARLWAGHFSFIEANAWLPVATGAAIGVRQRFGISLLALAVGLLALAGQPEMLIFALWWLPLWAGLATLADGPRPVAWALARAIAGVGLGVGLAAFQIIPVVELLSTSNRQTGMAWDFRTGASLPPWHLLEVFAPTMFGDPRGSYWPGPGYEWHERLLYIGAIPLLAAIWARGQFAWICWGLAALAVALAFGSYVPWYAWTDVLPGYQSLRIPSKHLTLAALALALAAGVGVQRLKGRTAALSSSLIGALLGLGSVTFSLWFPALSRVLGGARPDAPDPVALQEVAARPLQSASVLLLAAACVTLWPAAWARRGMLFLAILELVVILHPFRDRLADPADILAGAGALRGYARAAMVGDGVFLANFGPVLHIVQPGGYVSLFSAGYMELLSGAANPGVVLSAPRESEPILRLLGYEIVIDEAAAQVTVFEPRPPLAWVARCVRPGGASEVREPSFPRDACITRTAATGADPTVPPGSALVVTERAGALVIDAQGPGWLVTVQPWYPGWSAEVDGRPTPVEVVDGALAGLALSDGPHRVALNYRPAGMDQGLALSAGVLVLLTIAVWWDWRRLPRLPDRMP